MIEGVLGEVALEVEPTEAYGAEEEEEGVELYYRQGRKWRQ